MSIFQTECFFTLSGPSRPVYSPSLAYSNFSPVFPGAFKNVELCKLVCHIANETTLVHRTILGGLMYMYEILGWPN